MTNRIQSVPIPDCKRLQLDICLDHSEKKPFRVIETACRLTGYSGGYFLVKDENAGCCGVVDREGKEVVAPAWDDVEIWPEDGPAEVFRLLRRQENGKLCWAFADTEGKLCSPFLVGEFLGFREGIGLIRTEKNTCYGKADYRDTITFVDRCGNTLFHSNLSNTNSNFRYPLYHDGILVHSDENYRYTGMDTAGNRNDGKTFQKLQDFAGGLAPAEKSRFFHPGTYVYGFVDKMMHWVIPPLYEAVRPFCNGYAQVRKNGKWGLVDPAGTVCLPPVWEELTDVREDGLVFGRWDGRAFLVTPEGKSVIPLDDDVTACQNLTEGLLAVRYKDDSLRFLDEDGRTVLFDSSWTALSPFHHGVAAIQRKFDISWQLIDYAGQNIPLPYHVHSHPEPGLLYGDHHIVYYGCPGLGGDTVIIPPFPKGSSCDTGEDAEQSLFYDSGWQASDGEREKQALSDFLRRLNEAEELCETAARLLHSGDEGDLFLYAFQCVDRRKVTSLCASFGERVSQQVPFDVLVLVGRTDSRIFSRLICSREIKRSSFSEKSDCFEKKRISPLESDLIPR